MRKPSALQRVSFVEVRSARYRRSCDDHADPGRAGASVDYGCTDGKKSGRAFTVHLPSVPVRGSRCGSNQPIP